MKRPGPESNPETRQGKISDGAKRSLPNLGARGIEIRAVHLNGHLDPSASIESLQEYLGVRTPIDKQSQSRNMRNPRYKLPTTPTPTESISWKEF